VLDIFLFKLEYVPGNIISSEFEHIPSPVQGLDLVIVDFTTPAGDIAGMVIFARTELCDLIN
jgi:hypothetical protein